MSLSDVAPPALLFSMMTVVGLDLRADDFRRVLRNRRAVWVSTVGQWTLLPLASFALLWALAVPVQLSAGIVLLLSAPGGGISNVLTLLAGANTALSVTLTALASVLTVVVLPVLSELGFALLPGDGPSGLRVPLLPFVAQLLAMIALPIALGMALRARWPAQALRAGPRLRALTLLAVGVVVALGAQNTETTALWQASLGGLGVGAAWTLLALALGYGLAAAARLPRADCATIAIEFAGKNVGLVAVVALGTLHRPDLAVFAGAYVLVGFPMVTLCALLWRRFAVGAIPIPAAERSPS